MPKSPSLSPLPPGSPILNPKSEPPNAPVQETVSRSQLGLLERVFGIDARTLALFRMGMALLILNDLRVRAADISAFYSDAGVLPRSAFIELISPSMPNMLSLHLMNGLVGFQIFLFVVAGLCAVGLFVGYQTRWLTFFSWLLIVSLHNRNPMIVHGGDVVLRMLLFWSLFLPLNRVWSLDAMLRGDSTDSSTHEDTPRPQHILSMGTVAIILQVCFIYWFTVALKSGSTWRSAGTAVFYTLSIDQFATPFGRSLLPYRAALSAITTFTMWIERFGPLLALFPIWRLRLGMIFVMVCFHAGMGVCLMLGSFPFVMSLCWCLFIPCEFWNWSEARYQALKPGKLEAVRNRLNTLQLSITAARLDQKRPSVLGIVAPHLVAQLKRLSKPATEGLAAFFLLYIFAWNCRTTDFPTYLPYFPTTVNWIGDTTRIDQGWGMFAPNPITDDGWYVIPATLANGKTVDLFRDGAPVDWAKPANVLSLYQNEHWQKYGLNIWLRQYSGHRFYYAHYLVRQWDKSHPPEERIVSLEIDFMEEDTDLSQAHVVPKKVVLWTGKF